MSLRLRTYESMNTLRNVPLVYMENSGVARVSVNVKERTRLLPNAANTLTGDTFTIYFFAQFDTSEHCSKRTSQHRRHLCNVWELAQCLFLDFFFMNVSSLNTGYFLFLMLHASIPSSTPEV